jgi:hypothetical protein
MIRSRPFLLLPWNEDRPAVGRSIAGFFWSFRTPFNGVASETFFGRMMPDFTHPASERLIASSA